MTLQDQSTDDFDEMVDTDEALTLEENLGDFAADLITDYDVFIERLFALPPGQWFEVWELCQDNEMLEERLTELENDAAGRYLVSWIDYHSEGYEPGFCTITFFIASLMRSYTAIYNRALFLKEHTAQ